MLTCRLLAETLIDVDQFKEQLNIDIPTQYPTQIYVPKQALKPPRQRLPQSPGHSRHKLFSLPTTFSSFLAGIARGGVGLLALAGFGGPMGSLTTLVTRTISIAWAFMSFAIHVSRLASAVTRGWVISFRIIRVAMGREMLNSSHNCKLVMKRSCRSTQAAALSKSSFVCIVSPLVAAKVRLNHIHYHKLKLATNDIFGNYRCFFAPQNQLR